MTAPGFTKIDNAAIERGREVGPSAFQVYFAIAMHAREEKESMARNWPVGGNDRVGGALDQVRNITFAGGGVDCGRARPWTTEYLYPPPN